MRRVPPTPGPPDPHGPPPASPPGTVDVLIGAPGVGKTFCLCKWMTRSVLRENRAVQVRRLNGKTVNPAESLTLYAGVLGSKCAISFLSAGQNVPENFHAATADHLLPGGSPSNGPGYAGTVPNPLAGNTPAQFAMTDSHL